MTSILLIADSNQRSSVCDVRNRPWLLERSSRDKWLFNDVVRDYPPEPYDTRGSRGSAASGDWAI